MNRLVFIMSMLFNLIECKKRRNKNQELFIIHFPWHLYLSDDKLCLMLKNNKKNDYYKVKKLRNDIKKIHTAIVGDFHVQILSVLNSKQVQIWSKVQIKIEVIIKDFAFILKSFIGFIKLCIVLTNSSTNLHPLNLFLAYYSNSLINNVEMTITNIYNDGENEFSRYDDKVMNVLVYLKQNAKLTLLELDIWLKTIFQKFKRPIFAFKIRNCIRKDRNMTGVSTIRTDQHLINVKDKSKPKVCPVITISEECLLFAHDIKRQLRICKKFILYISTLVDFLSEYLEKSDTNVNFDINYKENVVFNEFKCIFKKIYTNLKVLNIKLKNLEEISKGYEKQVLVVDNIDYTENRENLIHSIEQINFIIFLFDIVFKLEKKPKFYVDLFNSPTRNSIITYKKYIADILYISHLSLLEIPKTINAFFEFNNKYFLNKEPNTEAWKLEPTEYNCILNKAFRLFYTYTDLIHIVKQITHQSSDFLIYLKKLNVYKSIDQSNQFVLNYVYFFSNSMTCINIQNYKVALKNYNERLIVLAGVRCDALNNFYFKDNIAASDKILNGL